MVNAKANSRIYQLMSNTDVILENVTAVKFQYNELATETEVAILLYTGDIKEHPIYRIGFSFTNLTITLRKYDPESSSWSGNLKVIS